MNITKFFRYVWRINAFIILVVSFAALFVLVWAGWHLFQDQERLRQRELQQAQAAPEDVSDEWSLGPFSAVAGTNYLMAPAFTAPRKGKGDLRHDVAPIRNYLFLDKATLNGHWLLEHNDYRLRVTDTISAIGSEASSLPTLGFILVADKAEQQAEALFIGIADPDGKRFRELLGPIDAYQGFEYRGDGRVLIFYILDDQYTVADVDIELQKVVSQQTLPRLPQKGQ